MPDIPPHLAAQLEELMNHTKKLEQAFRDHAASVSDKKAGINGHERPTSEDGQSELNFGVATQLLFGQSPQPEAVDDADDNEDAFAIPTPQSKGYDIDRAVQAIGGNYLKAHNLYFRHHLSLGNTPSTRNVLNFLVRLLNSRNVKLQDIDNLTIADFWKLRSEEVKATTLKQNFSLLNSYFLFLTEQGVFSTNPMRGIYISDSSVLNIEPRLDELPQVMSEIDAALESRDQTKEGDDGHVGFEEEPSALEKLPIANISSQLIAALKLKGINNDHELLAALVENGTDEDWLDTLELQKKSRLHRFLQGRIINQAIRNRIALTPVAEIVAEFSGINPQEAFAEQIAIEGKVRNVKVAIDEVVARQTAPDNQPQSDVVVDADMRNTIPPVADETVSLSPVPEKVDATASDKKKRGRPSYNLDSFPIFDGKHQTLLAALHTLNIYSRAELLEALVSKGYSRTAVNAGLAKFLEGQIADQRVTPIKPSTIAIMVAGLVDLPAATVFPNLEETIEKPNTSSLGKNVIKATVPPLPATDYVRGLSGYLSGRVVKFLANEIAEFSLARNILWETQKECFESIGKHIVEPDGNGRFLITSVMGSGKTNIFLTLAALASEQILADKKKIIIVTANNQLVNQTYDRAKLVASDVWFDDANAENDMIGRVNTYFKDHHQHLIVTTPQSLVAGLESGNLKPQDIGMLILDEGHTTGLSDLRQEAINSLTDTLMFSFTATAKTLGQQYREIYRLDAEEAVERKIIAPFANVVIRTDIADLKNVRTLATGGYDQSALSEAVNRTDRNRVALDFYKTWIDETTGIEIFGRPGFIVTTDIKHAESVAELINEDANIDPRWKDILATGQKIAATLHSNVPKDERERILREHKEGKILFVIGVDMVTLGIDNIEASVCINLAPTLSQVFAAQRGGRVLRMDKNHTDKFAYVVDVVDERGPEQRPILFAEAIGASPELMHKWRAQHGREKLDTSSLQSASLELDYAVISDAFHVNEMVEEFGAERERFSRRPPQKEDDDLIIIEIMDELRLRLKPLPYTQAQISAIMKSLARNHENDIAELTAHDGTAFSFNCYRRSSKARRPLCLNRNEIPKLIAYLQKQDEILQDTSKLLSYSEIKNLLRTTSEKVEELLEECRYQAVKSKQIILPRTGVVIPATTEWRGGIVRTLLVPRTAISALANELNSALEEAPEDSVTLHQACQVTQLHYAALKPIWTRLEKEYSEGEIIFGNTDVTLLCGYYKSKTGDMRFMVDRSLVGVIRKLLVESVTNSSEVIDNAVATVADYKPVALTTYDFLHQQLPALLKTLQDAGISTKDDLRDVLVKKGYHRNSIQPLLGRFLSGFVTEVSGTTLTLTPLAKFIAELAGVPANQVYEKAFLEAKKQWENEQARAIEIRGRGKKTQHLADVNGSVFVGGTNNTGKKRGRASFDLKNFPYLQNDAAELLTALQAKGIHTRLDLINSLARHGINQNTALVGVAKFLTGHLLDTRSKPPVLTTTAIAVAAIAGMTAEKAYGNRVKGAVQTKDIQRPRPVEPAKPLKDSLSKVTNASDEATALSSIALFAKEAREFDFLTREQEFAFADQIRSGRRAIVEQLLDLPNITRSLHEQYSGAVAGFVAVNKFFEITDFNGEDLTEETDEVTIIENEGNGSTENAESAQLSESAKKHAAKADIANRLGLATMQLEAFIVEQSNRQQRTEAGNPLTPDEEKAFQDRKEDLLETILKIRPRDSILDDYINNIGAVKKAEIEIVRIARQAKVDVQEFLAIYNGHEENNGWVTMLIQAGVDPEALQKARDNLKSCAVKAGVSLPYLKTKLDQLRQAQKSVVGSKNDIIQTHLRQGMSVARKYMGRGLDFEDLVQEANLGLMKAADKFDPRFGYRFNTYSYYWIQSTIQRALADKGATIRIPVHRADGIKKLWLASKEILQTTGRRATDKELAEKLETTEKSVRAMREAGRASISLDMPVGNDPDSDTSLGELIEDKNAVNPLDSLLTSDLKIHIAAALDTMKPKEADILRMRFGIGMDSDYTLEEVGQVYGVTRERIRQIEAKALDSLRKKAHRLRLTNLVDDLQIAPPTVRAAQGESLHQAIAKAGRRPLTPTVIANLSAAESFATEAIKDNDPAKRGRKPRALRSFTEFESKFPELLNALEEMGIITTPDLTAAMEKRGKTKATAYTNVKRFVESELSVEELVKTSTYALIASIAVLSSPAIIETAGTQQQTSNEPVERRINNKPCDLSLFLNTNQILLMDRDLQLTEKEAAIFSAIIATNGNPISKESLYQKLYGTATAVADKIIDVYVSKIRTKLKMHLASTGYDDEGGVLIGTSRKQGYYLDLKRFPALRVQVLQDRSINSLDTATTQRAERPEPVVVTPAVSVLPKAPQHVQQDEPKQDSGKPTPSVAEVAAEAFKPLSKNQILTGDLHAKLVATTGKAGRPSESLKGVAFLAEQASQLLAKLAAKDIKTKEALCQILIDRGFNKPTLCVDLLLQFFDGKIVNKVGELTATAKIILDVAGITSEEAFGELAPQEQKIAPVVSVSKSDFREASASTNGGGKTHSPAPLTPRAAYRSKNGYAKPTKLFGKLGVQYKASLVQVMANWHAQEASAPEASPELIRNIRQARIAVIRGLLESPIITSMFKEYLISQAATLVEGDEARVNIAEVSHDLDQYIYDTQQRTVSNEHGAGLSEDEELAYQASRENLAMRIISLGLPAQKIEELTKAFGSPEIGDSQVMSYVRRANIPDEEFLDIYLGHEQSTDWVDFLADNTHINPRDLNDLHKYIRSLHKKSGLPFDEFRRVATDIGDGNRAFQEALSDLLQQQSALVDVLHDRFKGSGISEIDLDAYIRKGLLFAIDVKGNDPTQDVIALANSFVSQIIHEKTLNGNGASAIPLEYQDKVNALRAMERKIAYDTGSKATAQELAAALGIDTKDVVKLKQLIEDKELLHQPASLTSQPKNRKEQNGHQPPSVPTTTYELVQLARQIAESYRNSSNGSEQRTSQNAHQIMSDLSLVDRAVSEIPGIADQSVFQTLAAIDIGNDAHGIGAKVLRGLNSLMEANPLAFQGCEYTLARLETLASKEKGESSAFSELVKTYLASWPPIINAGSAAHQQAAANSSPKGDWRNQR